MQRLLAIFLCFLVFLSGAAGYAQALTPSQKNLISIPVSSSFVVQIQSSLNSATINSGDTIAATLKSDWTHNGMLIAPTGSILYGEIVKVKKADKFFKDGSFALTFNEILTPKGKKMNVKTNTIVLGVESTRVSSIVISVIGGVIVGAVNQGLAAILVALSLVAENRKTFEEYFPEAIAGIIITPIEFASEKGAEIELPAQTSLDIRLTERADVYIK